MTSVTMQRPLEQTVAKFSWIVLQIRISNELNKITLKCKADQTAEFSLVTFNNAQYFG